MSSVVISGDTSGAITLAAPAVAGTNTITLPASTGTVLTTGSPQSGGVIQVVNATYATQVSTTSATFTATGLTASITPKFATSKILVTVIHSGVATSAGGGGLAVQTQLLRNSTVILSLDSLGLYSNGSTQSVGTDGCATYLDSPATTSSTTYSTKFAARNGIATAYVQYDGGGGSTSTITLMEIAA